MSLTSSDLPTDLHERNAFWLSLSEADRRAIGRAQHRADAENPERLAALQDAIERTPPSRAMRRRRLAAAARNPDVCPLIGVMNTRLEPDQDWDLGQPIDSVEPERRDAIRRDLVTYRKARARAQRDDVMPRSTRPGSRPRGAGRPRAAATRSSARSGDSADDDSDEPSPGDGRRCAAPWCSRRVYGVRKRFCGTGRCNQARAAERQRHHRAAGLISSEREQLDDARRAGYVVFGEPGEHALAFLWKFAIVDGTDPGEFHALISGRRCRCNGHHIDGGIVGCLKCGMVRGLQPTAGPCAVTSALHGSGR